MATPAVEFKRLQAAATLSLRPVGPTQYLVWGGAESHYVDLSAEGAAAPRCDCADALYRGDRFLCKHILAALGAEGDAEIRAALTALRPARVAHGYTCLTEGCGDGTCPNCRAVAALARRAA